MDNPIKIDLYLSDRLPVIRQSGGNAQQIVDNMKNRMYNYLISGPNSPTPVVLEFDKTLNTKTDNAYSLYMNMGSVKAIFGLKNHPEYNKLLKDLPSQLVLRCFDNMLDDEFNVFIGKWKKDKHTFEDFIIDIYLYGKIYDSKDNLICKYILTRKYEGYDQIAVLNENDSIKLYVSLLEFLKYLKDNNIIYRNLKFSNIGFKRKSDGSIQLVILDYDNITLLYPSDDYFDSFKYTGCGSNLCAGDLIPYYVAHDYFYSNPKWKERLDKLYSFGLAEITMSLFFRYNEKFNDVYKLFSGLASLGPCLHYYHLMAIFDSRDKYENIIGTISELKNKFPSMNPLLEKELYVIIINLISKDYDQVRYPGQILTKIMECLSSNPDFQEKNEPMPIHPIGSVPAYKPSPTQIENLFADSRTGMTDRMIAAVDKQLGRELVLEETGEVEVEKKQQKGSGFVNKSGWDNSSSSSDSSSSDSSSSDSSSSDLEYKDKYLKYKNKYRSLISKK
jgi:serine/threonine protein kinase